MCTDDVHPPDDHMPRFRCYSAAFIPLLPVLAAVFVYHLDTFDPLPFLDDNKSEPPLFIPRHNSRMLLGSEKIGEGELNGPEDIAFDPNTGDIYTGCEDGWVSRVTPGRSPVVKKWVNTGGRPLGIAHGQHDEVLVADAEKGLLNISKDGVIELLTDEANGLKFKLTNAIDVGPDGTLYFTDSSSKYRTRDCLLDLLEGRPNGRLLSYDPFTKQTRVLAENLYFSNGVSVSADKTYLIFCETPMRRCKKYFIEGPRKGSVETFIENLPGLPDNIKYDGEGHYWIALSLEANKWQLLQRYPSVRKVLGIMEKYKIPLLTESNTAGVIAVDSDGKPVAYYYDRGLYSITSGNRIGKHVYLGAISYPYMFRFNESRYPATPVA